MGSGKAPKPTAEQKAMERRQREALDEERASSERRLKAIAQKKIGKQSLLGKPMEQAEAPEGPMVTEGFKQSGGRVVKIPKRTGLFSKLFKSGLMGGAAAGQGLKSASLLGKGAEKAIKGVAE